MRKRVERKIAVEVLKEAGGAKLIALCICVALVVSCGGQSSSKDSDTDGKATSANVKKGVKPEPDAQAAVIDTDFGKIVVELYPNIAPQMVERFKKLISEGFYNGTTFHRINPTLGVIQGGDPNSKDDNPANDGSGDSPYPDLPAEFSDIPFERGVLGAARQGKRPAFGNQPEFTEEQARDTANCQFYITLKRVPDWDADYTVFGRVIDGMNTADIISTAPTGQRPESPDPKIVIRSITLQPRANFAR